MFNTWLQISILSVCDYSPLGITIGIIGTKKSIIPQSLRSWCIKETNWIIFQSGFIGCLDEPQPEWPLDNWSWSGSSQRNAPLLEPWDNNHWLQSFGQKHAPDNNNNNNTTSLNRSCYFQDSGVDDLLTNSTFSTSRRSISPSGSKRMLRSPSPSRRKFTSTPRPDDTVVNHKKPFLVRHKDNNLLENRDFSSFDRPKPRRTRSRSPTRRPRSTSPSRLGTSSVLPLPGTVV